jgi:hypothetical protein
VWSEAASSVRRCRCEVLRFTLLVHFEQYRSGLTARRSEKSNFAPARRFVRSHAFVRVFRGRTRDLRAGVCEACEDIGSSHASGRGWSARRRGSRPPVHGGRVIDRGRRRRTRRLEPPAADPCSDARACRRRTSFPMRGPSRFGPLPPGAFAARAGRQDPISAGKLFRVFGPSKVFYGALTCFPAPRENFVTNGEMSFLRGCKTPIPPPASQGAQASRWLERNSSFWPASCRAWIAPQGNSLRGAMRRSHATPSNTDTLFTSTPAE